MTRAWKSWVGAVVCAGAFFAGVVGLFNRQFASGELYPEFSSMRTDRFGTKLIYDSLARLPGVTVERNFLPLEFLPRDGATLVLLGVDPIQVNWNDALILRYAEAIARRGNRVVLAMHLDPEDRSIKQDQFDRREEPKTRLPKKKSKAGPEAPPLNTMWKVNLKLDPGQSKPHRLYFGQAEGWTVRQKVGDKPLAIERDFGKGSILLMAESAEFTNESVVALNGLAELSQALGPYRRIVFDEQHLGIAESGSVVGMARQFRLMGLAAGLALCVGLFIWRNASGFPPPAANHAVERFAGRTSQAGLLTLLKRHIRPAELAAVCWREWLSTNGHQAKPEIKRRAETIIADAGSSPVQATREIEALLHAKGEL